MDTIAADDYTASELRCWLEKLGLPKSGTKATLAARLNGVPPEARGDCPVLDPKDMTDIEAGPEEWSNTAAVQGTDQDDVGATSLDAQNNDEAANNNMCVPEISMQLESLKRHLEVVELNGANSFLSVYILHNNNFYILGNSYPSQFDAISQFSESLRRLFQKQRRSDFEKCRRSGTFLPDGSHFRDPNAISRTIVFIFLKSLNSAFRDRKCLQGIDPFIVHTFNFSYCSSFSPKFFVIILIDDPVSIMALRRFPFYITPTYGQHFLYPSQFAEIYVHSTLSLCPCLLTGAFGELFDVDAWKFKGFWALPWCKFLLYS